jgi:putative transcriptional regulator
MTTAEKIRDLRKATGWSQEELAVKMKCAFGTVNRWESGKMEPRGLNKATLEKLFTKYLPKEGDAA